MSPLLQTLSAASVRAFGWSRGSAAGGGAMELISTQILGTAAATITFSSIPQTYKHLQVRVVGRFSANSSGNVDLSMRVNGDTVSGHYAWHQLIGNGSSATFNTATSTNYIAAGVVPNNLATTNTFSGTVIDVLDYTSASKNKTIRALGGVAPASTLQVQLASGLWISTAAVTSLSFFDGMNVTNFMVGTRISLYGVLG